mmetsp:Transcript_33585/g.77473  ORF Transcript_33585/g.77473 Transcript_33585/m.77473 type:complete len:247 (+) Transcript_33585:604-1344(+)
MAKVGGTEINGELAMHFERVCGNKGYSYDAHQANVRFNNSLAGHVVYQANDIIYKGKGKHWNRGHVPLDIMREIGFENCDYVALEEHWEEWPTIFRGWYRPLELHVPCRESVDLLMSACNYRLVKKFDCSATTDDEIKKEVDRCFRDFLKRFSINLLNLPDIRVKCFSSPSRMGDYLEYVGSRLQRKSFESKYVHRNTNPRRKRDRECVWKDDSYREKIKKYLMRHESGYFKFCDSCIGSKDDLLP